MRMAVLSMLMVMPMVMVVGMGVVVRVVVVVIDQPRPAEPPEMAVRPVVGVDVDEVAVTVQHTGARAGHG